MAKYFPGESFTPDLRKKLILENSNPVHNLWSFYQHATVLKIMSEGAKEAIIEYQKRALGATVADVLQWHEGRFETSGSQMPELWKKHLELFRAPGGKFVCAEEKIKVMADKDGDGNIDWDEVSGTWTYHIVTNCV